MVLHAIKASHPGSNKQEMEAMLNYNDTLIVLEAIYSMTSSVTVIDKISSLLPRAQQLN